MNGELENRIAELQQRGKAAKEQTAAELDRQKTALSEHAEGIKARLDGAFLDRVAEFVTVGKQASKALLAAEAIDHRHQALGEQIAANEVLLRRQARWAWLALGGACLAAAVIISLAIWGGARLIDNAGQEADAIRVANAADLVRARELGQRAIADLHEELAGQQAEIERRIALAGVELADLTGERDRLMAELEQFADLRDRLGIQLIEARSASPSSCRRGRKSGHGARRDCMSWRATTAGCSASWHGSDVQCSASRSWPS